ncbi:uncharacterized protein TNIN_274171 [Trichonephila inaurata madagascariensis]|uniref:Uncharacterized protein n=1 Tax=Trichonephila inaurata madagascariensis TaxID=2747483 RepID=A0A8X7BZG1_9ARAC|nr:uncharacterized protein TNIN_274171 [Trichonephila inaurata madagascariensis]
MLCLLLLSMISTTVGTGPSYYPLIIPIRTSGPPKHTTHVVTHPVIRTQVLVLNDDDHHHNRNQHSLVHNHQDNEYRNQILNQESRIPHLSQENEYSIPVEESSWKPIQGFPTGYLPLKYLGEDVHKVSDVVRKAMRHSVRDDDDETNLILPVGIKKLHNPQLRLPRRKPFKSRYSNLLTEGRHTRGRVVYDAQPNQKNTFPRNKHFSFENVRCHCQIMQN